MPPAIRIPHQWRGGNGRVPRPPKERFFLMVQGQFATRIAPAPGTATTGFGDGAVIPGGRVGAPTTNDGGASGCPVGAAFMPPATRIPHQCRGGIHAARDPHPAPMPGRHSCRPPSAVRHVPPPASRGTSRCPSWLFPVDVDDGTLVVSAGAWMPGHRDRQRRARVHGAVVPHGSCGRAVSRRRPPPARPIP